MFKGISRRSETNATSSDSDRSETQPFFLESLNPIPSDCGTLQRDAEVVGGVFEGFFSFVVCFHWELISGSDTLLSHHLEVVQLPLTVRRQQS